MTTTFSGVRHKAWMVCIALAWLAELESSAQAEGAATPLAEMRAAAEALAEIDPGLPNRAGEALLIQSPGSRAPDRNTLIRDAMREAVRSEVAAERAALERASAGRGAGAAKADSAADNGHSAAGQARAAAAQAQQAQRNSNVSQLHRQNQADMVKAPASGRGVGQSINAK